MRRQRGGGWAGGGKEKRREGGKEKRREGGKEGRVKEEERKRKGGNPARSQTIQKGCV